MEKLEIYDENVIQILKKIHDAGYKAYIVGGCVRDLLLNKEPTDYDIATSALPQQTISIFKDYQIDTTGIKHGTVRVLIANNEYEITTFRIEDKYEDHRHPSLIEFTTCFKDDLSRRDFTINALGYNEYEGLIDYYDGIEDLNDKVLKTIGKAETRFEEDALRILRALRFASRFNLKIDPQTSIALLNKKELIKYISNERIYEEISKLLLTDYCDRIMFLYKDIFTLIFESLQSITNSEYYKRIHTITKVDKNLSCRLSVLLHGTINWQDDLYKLHVDKNTMQQVGLLNSHFLDFILLDTISIKKMLSIMSQESLDQLINIQYQYGILDNYFVEQYQLLINEIINNKMCYKLADLALKGNDLIELGITGKQIKETLNHLLYLVINEQVDNNVDDLKKYLKNKEINNYKQHYLRMLNKQK